MLEVTTRQADGLIGVRHGTVIAAIEGGERPAYKHGRRYRVDVDELFHWWKSKKKDSRGQPRVQEGKRREPFGGNNTMNDRERPCRDAYNRMDMALACTLGSFATTVFWAVCILLGVI